MGKRSTFTTKSGKYMNPTDQARKEARKRELKKNKKQRKFVRESVLKMKDPKSILEEMLRIDLMEIESLPEPLPNDKALKEKKKKLKETLDRILKLYDKQEKDKFDDIKKLQVDYELKRQKAFFAYQTRRSKELEEERQKLIEEEAANILLPEIPMPHSGLLQPSDIPLPLPMMHPGTIPMPQSGPPMMPPPGPPGVSPMVPSGIPHIPGLPPGLIPPGPPPGPPPGLSPEPEKSPEPEPEVTKELNDGEQEYDPEEYDPEEIDMDSDFDSGDAGAGGGDSDTDLDSDAERDEALEKGFASDDQLSGDELEDAKRRKGEERKAKRRSVHFAESPEINRYGGDSNKKEPTLKDRLMRIAGTGYDKEAVDFEPMFDEDDDGPPGAPRLTVPPGPPPGAPPGLPPGFPPRPPGMPLGNPPRMMPPGPPPGRPPGPPPGMPPPRGHLGVPPPMIPPPRPLGPGMHLHVGLRPHGPPPGFAPMQGPVLSAPPMVLARPLEMISEEQDLSTISAKPQIRNIRAEVTKLVPTALRVRRDPKSKLRKTNLTPAAASLQTALSKGHEGPTKDDVYAQFMNEMEGFL